MDSVHENLIAAKALIDTPDKWIKGDYSRGECMCALGASRAVMYGAPDWHDGVEMEKDGWSGDVNPISKALREQLHPVWLGQIDEFNDDPKTTHADIMALFDRAIAATAPSGDA